MGHKVIHMIEAVDWLEEIEYSRLVEQCRQNFCFLAGKKECVEQVCLIFSDKVKEIQTENGQWPGDAAFRRSKRKKRAEKNDQKVCFEDALYASAVHMQEGDDWVVILYTAGAIKRSKRTMLTKWKKTLPVLPTLLAINTKNADSNFLMSYTEAEKTFYVGMTEAFCEWWDKYEKSIEELWKIIRDCFT